MLMFIFIILLVCLLSNRIKNPIYKYLAFIVLALLIVFSFGYGTDYFSYKYLYESINISHVLGNEKVDSLYLLVEIIFTRIGIPYHLFSIIWRLSVLSVFLLWIYKSSKDIEESVLLFFSMFFTVWVMSAYRQGFVLALGSFYFFSSEKELSITKSILVIVMLSLVHPSALIYLLYLFSRRFSWTKKHHLILFLAAIFSTFIPIGFYELVLGKLPLGSQILIYLGDSSPTLLDFASLMRIFFFLVVISCYDILSSNRFNKILSDAFLLGTSIYFVLKFSEITASRINIFTFILIVVLLPQVIKIYYSRFNYNKVLNVILVVGISVIFLTKEMYNYKIQVGYTGTKSIFQVDSIFNYDLTNYDNIYSFRDHRIDNSKLVADNFIEGVDSLEQAQYNATTQYLGVKSPTNGKFGIIGSDNKWLFEPQFDAQPKIYGDVFTLDYVVSLVPQVKYFDMKNIELDQEKLRTRQIQNQLNILESSKLVEIDINKGFKELFDENNIFNLSYKNVGGSRTVKIVQSDVTYHIVFLQYYKYNLFIYLDENLLPYSDLVFTNITYYNSEGFLRLQSYGKQFIIAKNGETIWIE